MTRGRRVTMLSLICAFALAVGAVVAPVVLEAQEEGGDEARISMDQGQRRGGQRKGAKGAKGGQRGGGGINDAWKGDDVGAMVGRLEGESREIFVQREMLAALAGPKPGSVVADVGAGSGFMVMEFAKLVGPEGKVYAVDINESMMKFVGDRAEEEGVENIETIVCPEDSTNLPANSVDMVFLCDTYHHFEFVEGSMNSIHAALKPGGQIILVEFHKRGRMGGHVRADEETFTQEIVDYGFELINAHYLPAFEENYILRFRKVERSPGTR